MNKVNKAARPRKKIVSVVNTVLVSFAGQYYQQDCKLLQKRKF